MSQFRHYLQGVIRIESLCRQWRREKNPSEPYLPSEEFLGEEQEYMAAFRRLCDRHGLKHSSSKLKATEEYLLTHQNDPINVSAMESEFRNIRETLVNELSEFTLVRVPKNKSAYVNNKLLFGEKVSEAFPSAVSDIVEAGNCLALECNTAAVFHLMRAVEWGLRALATHLGVKSVRSVRGGKRVKYTPLSHSQWEQILDRIHNEVDVRLKKVKRGDAKQDLQEFYYPALQEIRAFKDAWRNHVMHSRAEYTSEDADAVFSHVKRFMGTLAARIAEV